MAATGLAAPISLPLVFKEQAITVVVITKLGLRLER